MKSFIIILISFISTAVFSQNCQIATVQLKLDNYPAETTWTITNNSTNAVLASGGPYSGQNNQLLNIGVCLVPGINYTFKINDSYGDGICCGYGQGYYNFIHNSQILFTGGQFTQSISHVLCLNCGAGATHSCTDGVQNGSETGVDCGGSCQPCGSSSGCTNVTFQIRTDNYPSESTWQLRNTATNSVVASGGPYSQANTISSQTLCLTPGQNYTFRILDSYGDGICCSYGQGYYNFKLGTNTLISGGSFTTAEEKSFCLQCSGGPVATCSDGVQNGNETGIDCGGSCTPCPTVPKRNIVFMHGLAGDHDSWSKVASVHNFNFNQYIPNWENRQMDARTISYNQSNISSSALDAASLIRSNMTSMRGSSTVPSINQDIVIAHSLGGLVMRESDKRFDFGLEPGIKPYGGIITFGTPHSGAQAATSLFNGSLDNFLNNNCTPLLQGPLSELTNISFPSAVLSSLANVLHTGPGLADNICDKFLITSVFKKLSDIPNLALDARIATVAANPPYTSPSVRKIAVFGVEQEPVLWRFLHSAKVKNSSFPFFGADDDTRLISDVQAFISLINTRINTLWLEIPFNPVGAFNKRDAWITTRTVVENLNTNYKSLITNTSSTFAFTAQCKVESIEYGNITRTRHEYSATPEGCDQYSFVQGCCFEDLSQPVFNINTVTEASDGFIPVSSQIAFPGATTLQMPNSNHEQMKNDSNTKIVLRQIYQGLSGGSGQAWWTIPTRN